MIGGDRRWFSDEPPGKSSGRLRQKLLPACTSLTPSSTFSEVMRLIRPSSSSSPQSPQVEPSGRRAHRFATADPPYYFVLSGRNKANRRPRRHASPHLRGVGCPARPGASRRVPSRQAGGKVVRSVVITNGSSPARKFASSALVLA